jgi:hypothetical protein
METIGKVLSLTLLTIFGSAAATVYLVDSDIMPSFFGKPAHVYTSDRTEQPDENADFYKVPERRERERESLHYAVVEKETGDVEEYNNIKPIWGQSYETDAVSARRNAERAREIARSSSLASITQNIDYWNNQFSTAQREGNQAAAQSALRNYTEYKEALEIKQSASR